MFLSELQAGCHLCLSKFQIFLSQLPNLFVQLENLDEFKFEFQNVFVQIAKCICTNCKMYLSKLQNVFRDRMHLCFWEAEEGESHNFGFLWPPTRFMAIAWFPENPE